MSQRNNSFSKYNVFYFVYVYCIVWLKQILVQSGETTSSLVNIQTQERNMNTSRQYRSFRALWTELNCMVRSLKFCFVFCLWFLLRCIGCVEFEKDNVSILHNVVPALLSVFSCSLNEANRTHLENVLRYSNSFVKGICKVNGINTSVRMNIKHTPWLHFHCLPL